MKKILFIISSVIFCVNFSTVAQTPPPLTIEAYDLIGNPLTNTPTICQFQSIEFYVQTPYESTEPKTFKWKKNGVVMLTQTAVNPSPPGISWNSSSLANGDVITLTATFTSPPPFYSPDSVTSQSITFTVTPNQPPIVVVTDNSPNDTICYGNTITFTATPIEAGTPTYQWYLDSGPVGTASTYTTSVTLLSGNHCIYCEITSSEACDSQDPVFNPVATSSPICFYVQPCYYYVPASGTLGPYYTCGSPFYDSALDNPINYSNNVNGLVKFCPAVVGQYVTVSFTSLNLNDAGDRLRIFSGTPSSTFTADTSGIPLFNIAGFTSCVSCAVVTSNVSGGCLTSHFRTDAAGNAAGWVANVTCSSTPTSVSEQNFEASLTIQPNPVSGELRIQNAELKIENIEIYNVLGKKIFSQQPGARSQQQIIIDVSNLNPGIYFVKVRGEKEEAVAKFVKQ
jgi:hypothetical protein